MAPPVKSTTEGTQAHDAAVKDLQREAHPSNNLWIGNLSPKVTDFELKTLFSAHGEVIGINSFPSRRYAFVNFKQIEGANLARQGLQGYVLHGKPLVINFAKSEQGAGPKEGQLRKRNLESSGIQLMAEHSLKNYPDSRLAGASKQNNNSLPNKCVSGGWDSFRSNELHREPKRSRCDTTDAVGHQRDQSDCMWRGTIAKGGLPVCRARCVAIGERVDTRLPNVVDCSGRIRLDLLSRQYANAIGSNLLLFLPDSEEEFPSYTEFLSHLIAKDRAGAAKLDDGTMLFLVPPSNFLTKVLNASAPLRLHGVVLKFSEPASNSRPMSALSIQPQYWDAHNETSLQTGPNVVYPEQRPLPVSISPPEAPRLLSSSLHGLSVPPADVNISGSKAIDQGTDASKFVSSSNIQQEACRVPSANQVSVDDASRPLPSEVECEHQNQQLQTAVNREVHESTETEADQKNERYRAMLLFAASLLSRVREQRGNSPAHGKGANDTAPSSSNYK